jgi:hypothetical protein
VKDKSFIDCPLRAREVAELRERSQFALLGSSRAVSNHLPSRGHLLSQSGLRYGCSDDAVFASGNSILGLGGAHADESRVLSSVLLLTIAKPEKESSSGLYCRSAAPSQLLVPLWDIQYK